MKDARTMRELIDDGIANGGLKNFRRHSDRNMKKSWLNKIIGIEVYFPYIFNITMKETQYSLQKF